MTSVATLYCLAKAKVHKALKALLPGCCRFPSEVVLWSTQMLVSTLIIDTSTSWVLEVILTACVMEIVLSERLEVRVSPCLGRRDETPVVLVALPTQGCCLEAVLCRH